jgi:hypothetical protein
MPLISVEEPLPPRGDMRGYFALNRRSSTIKQQTRLSATAVAYNKSKCKFYTGVSYDVFMTIFTFLSQFMIIFVLVKYSFSFRKLSISKYNFSRSATETVLRSSVGGVKICSSGASVSAVYIAIGSMFSSFGNNPCQNIHRNAPGGQIKNFQNTLNRA